MWWLGRAIKHRGVSGTQIVLMVDTVGKMTDIGLALLMEISTLLWAGSTQLYLLLPSSMVDLSSEKGLNSAETGESSS